MSKNIDNSGEEIVVNFLAAYGRKEERAGKRIPYKQAAKEAGISYFSFTSLARGDYRTISLDNLLKVMVWLETDDFNDMFERRKPDEKPKKK